MKFIYCLSRPVAGYITVLYWWQAEEELSENIETTFVQ